MVVLTKAIFHVHGGSSTLQDTEGLDDSLRHTVLRLVNVEVAQRAVLTQSAPSEFHHMSSFKLGPYRWVCAPQYLSPGTYHETQIRDRIHNVWWCSTHLDLTESIAFCPTLCRLHP